MRPLIQAIFIALALPTLALWTYAATTDAQAMLKLHVDFDREWEMFLLKEVGCPIPVPGNTTVYTVADCNQPQQYDYAAYLRSRRLAMKVFDLEDRH